MNFKPNFISFESLRRDWSHSVILILDRCNSYMIIRQKKNSDAIAFDVHDLGSWSLALSAGSPLHITLVVVNHNRSWCLVNR